MLERMKLYFAPRTRATRPRWLLEELEVPYELVRLDLAKSEHRSAEFLALNPLGEVPVLVDDEVILFESSAICLHLADRYPERRLAPPPGSPERGDYLQWLLFAEVTLEPVIAAQGRPTAGPPLEVLLSLVERRLEGREVLVGNGFTAADVVMASILHRAHTMKLLEGHARLFEYVLRHTRRPATLRAVSS